MERAQEPVEDQTGAAPEARLRMVTEKVTVRRPPSSRLALAGLVLPAVVAAAAGFLAGPGAERTLASEASAALRAEKVQGVRVEADGPFLTAYVPTRVDPRRVEDVVGGVAGVSAVTTEEVYSSKKEAQACAGLSRALNQVTRGQRIPFVGETSRLTDEGQRMVNAAAKLVSACGTARVYVGGHTDTSTVNGSTLTLRRAQTMIALMRKAGAPEERLVPRGYGAEYPVSEGDSPADRQRNQRGSIVVAEG